MIQQAEGTFDTTGVFAGMVILAVFVLVIDWVRDAGREAPAGLAARRPRPARPEEHAN